MEVSGLKYTIRPVGACVRVSGSDGFAYLQSQISQDLRPLSAGGVAYGLWLDRKGKIRADSFVLHSDGDYYLLAHGLSADALIERASVNVIADDVCFEAVDGASTAFSVFGDGAEGAVEGVLKALGAGGECEVDAAIAPVPGVVAIYAGLVPGSFTAVLDGATADGFARLLEEQGCGRDDGSAYCRARVDGGILEFPDEVDGNDLPQEAGFERLAISYSKGCYFGQEVMARLKAMGKPRNGLARIQLEADGDCELPADLLAGDEKIGQVRVLAGMVGLAVVSHRRMPQADGEVRLAATGQRALLKGWVL